MEEKVEMDVDIELVIGTLTILAEVTVVYVTLYARRRMSNPKLMKYMTQVCLAIVFLFMFSIWHTSVETLQLSESYGALLDVPPYIFLLFANVIFLYGSITILKMSREYGFQTHMDKIGPNVKKKEQDT